MWQYIYVAGRYEMSPSPSEYNSTTFSQLQREEESSIKPFSDIHCFKDLLNNVQGMVVKLLLTENKVSKIYTKILSSKNWGTNTD